MHFKGHHVDRKMMTYKSKYYGLQTYALCQKGYTFQIFMCSSPTPKTYLAKRTLPLHARVIELFDTVE